MPLKNVLRSNHDLKKNGYVVLRKLKDVNKPRNWPRVSVAGCPEGAFYYLSCKGLIDTMKSIYIDSDAKWVLSFFLKADSFLEYLKETSENRRKISLKRVSSFEKEYTQFFHMASKEQLHFTFNDQSINIWNKECLMAYLAVWGGRRSQ